ncbi:squalene synthase HpnC [Aldersonia sp. NBC_00410]|uniref:squalene synthase HpnC n=1 Tax=Aldersonia sp. NBC_00410 TaxID=2975954 RepID=UPI002250B15A|nr:squalene synthase HpnC [Aldersonia sp. NBC_00410]MCX5043744.1 squalene synthase HpnC [Aldersonia sp. NBC_00410]
MHFASESNSMHAEESAENFPVALRLLPGGIRRDLHALYAVARTIDNLGDETLGGQAARDRVAALTEFRSDLRGIWGGAPPRHPVLRDLVPTVRAHDLTVQPFEQLIEANLVDQRVTRYDTFADLIGYCRLSADPVGRLVLAVFGCESSTVAELSDRVCRALQLVEHWADVAEDRAAGRIYLPGQDMAQFGVTESDLDRPHASAALRELMRFEIDRAAALLESGAPIVGHLHGWARVAVAGYVAGGRAAVHALRRTGGDVLGCTATTSKPRTAAIALRLLVAPTRHARSDEGGGT